MGWRERIRDLGERLAAGEITTAEYRAQSDLILAEADQEADQDADQEPKEKVHIPVSAAWEAPSGEMTQIVGTDETTTVVDDSITHKLDET